MTIRSRLGACQGIGFRAAGTRALYILSCMPSRTAADLVRELRERADVSQTELARRAGMAQSAISDYERGRKEPSLSTLQRLAAAVDLVAEVRYRPAPGVRSLASLRRKRR